MNKDERIPWIDPQTGEILTKKGNFLVSKDNKFRIHNEIPNFVDNIRNKKQNQVSKSFGYKWSNSSFGQNDKEFQT